MNTFDNNLQAIQQRIAQASAIVGRNDTVHLCAVSKAQSAEKIKMAYQAGQMIFGENYLQEALDKMAQLKDCNIEWHFIGPIQSNKTQAIAQHFDWVQSVDRIKIAQRLSDARPQQLAPLNICLQVNSSNEPSKSGLPISEVLSTARTIKTMPNLTLRGIMAIPAPSNSQTEQHAQFRVVRDLFDELNDQGLALDTLSIGMSDDFEAAIAEGATIVRIGTALFGARHRS